MKRVRKFLSLSSREKFLLVKAAMLVIAIRIGLTFLPFATLHNLVAKCPREKGIPNKKERPSIEQIAWSVRAAGYFVPKATCLVQALAIQAFLQREGFPAILQIGVTKGDKGELQAHAWVESQGKVLNGGLKVEQYKPLLYQ
jgi:hypothetical protein